MDESNDNVVYIAKHAFGLIGRRSRKARLAWFDALSELAPGKSRVKFAPAIGKELVEAGLAAPVIYSGQPIRGAYRIPKSVAFVTTGLVLPDLADEQG